jgi:hypothetical protein
VREKYLRKSDKTYRVIISIEEKRRERTRRSRVSAHQRKKEGKIQEGKKRKKNPGGKRGKNPGCTWSVL